MEFKDYRPEELVGKKVKVISGSPYRRLQETSVITRVTPTGKSFEIKNYSGHLFNSDSGEQKGGNSRCQLITNEEYNQINTQNEITNKCLKRKNEIIQYDLLSIQYNYSNLKKLEKIMEIMESMET